MDTDKIIAEGARLKEQIAIMEESLKNINAALAMAAEFKDGCKTGHLVGAGYRVKVVKRDNIKWHQDRLKLVKENLPAHFNKVFVAEYSPESKKALDLEMAVNPDFAKAIEWSREIKEGTPYITYERIEDNVETNS
jgi:hypothetical protein